jgi:hypothetical protein
LTHKDPNKKKRRWRKEELFYDIKKKTSNSISALVINELARAKGNTIRLSVPAQYLSIQSKSKGDFYPSISAKYEEFLSTEKNLKRDAHIKKKARRKNKSLLFFLALSFTLG